MPDLVSHDARIFLAGHTGLVGGAIYRTLQAQGFTNLLVRDYTEVDLTDQVATRRFFDEQRPEAVIDAAAKVGGIMANWELPWEFVEQNLLIELNLIGEAFRHEVKRMVFLGSSCIYPREAPQPLKEEYLLTGPLEETNRAYAIAKISGIEMCRSLNREYGTDYLSLMPTNLYGPGDNFDLNSSHVLPAMIRKFHEAKVALEAGAAAPETALALWGTGKPRREFLYVEDVARAITFALQHVHAADVPDGLLNVGCGEDVTIRELADIVQRAVGYQGPVLWDDSKPDGTPRKLMDVTRIKSLGWAPEVGLEEGVRRTYEWFLANRT
jgi:GDP-L-fucose synthase